MEFGPLLRVMHAVFREGTANSLVTMSEKANNWETLLTAGKSRSFNQDFEVSSLV